MPEGVLNAHLCLSDRCVFHYKWSQKYTGPENQVTVAWNDPDVGIDWLIKDPILSERDKVGKSLKEAQLAIEEKISLEEAALNQKLEFDKGTVAKLRDGDEEFFELKTIDYGFGERLTYVKKNQKDYETLQGARGGAVLLDGSKQDVLLREAKKETTKIHKKDLVRINELDYIVEKLHMDMLKSGNKVAELGFRIPKLLKYYQMKGLSAKGFDVLDVNIMTGQLLGYDVSKYDFNKCSKDLDFKGVDLVLSYHMLEHLSDPLKAIKKIYNAMEWDAHFHVEVPIEGGFSNMNPETMLPWENPDMTKRKYNMNVPNIRYGHLFAFHPNDLSRMLEMAGFFIILASDQTHEVNTGFIERYFVKKIKPMQEKK